MNVCAQCSFIRCSSTHSRLHELQLRCLFQICVSSYVITVTTAHKKSQSNEVNYMDLWGQLDRRPFTMSIYEKKIIPSVFLYIPIHSLINSIPHINMDKYLIDSFAQNNLSLFEMNIFSTIVVTSTHIFPIVCFVSLLWW